MNLEVKLFARAKDLAGADSVVVEIGDAARTVADLKAALSEQIPQLAPLVPHLLVAIGTAYADDSMTLQQSDSISCFPPVSGG
jgi:molybdopterin converting factor small subunit